MEQKTKSQALQNLDDVNHQLHALENIFESIQLECNRNRHLYLLCDKGLEVLQILKKIINSTDLTFPLKLSLEVKRIFSVDSQVSTVIVAIINSKRISKTTGIAHLNQIV
jgi:hypothetical protein